MKNIKKILMGAVLGVLFLGAVIFFVKSYFVQDKEQDTTKKIVQKKKQAAKTYTLGEDVETGNIIWNVTEAEMIADYEEIDDYYKARGYLQSPEKYIIKSDRELMFPEEIQYIHLKFSITNNGSTEKNFAPNGLGLTSIVDNNFEEYSFARYDGRYSSKGADKEKVIRIDGGEWYTDVNDTRKLNYSVQPKETVDVDFIGQIVLDAESGMYSLYNNASSDNRYDLYLLVYSVGTEIVQNSFTSGGVAEKIRLNIIGRFGSENGAYSMVRNIQEMKCRSWTNLEFTDQITESYSMESIEKEIIESEEAGQQFIELYHEHTDGYKTTSALVLNTTLTDMQIADWKDIPVVYKEQGSLQTMAQRYQDVYGYADNELKVLLLDLTYSTEQIGQLQYEEDKILIYDFYGGSRIYVKNKEEKLHLFGLADDWTVLSNSANPDNLGAVNLETMRLEDTVTIQMAYILPPEACERYDALYFTGGRSWYGTDDEKWLMTKIALR